MKSGDLVRPGRSAWGSGFHAGGYRTGLVVEVIDKKHWNTSTHGKKVNWNAVDPEPHAVVVWSNGLERTIPICELEVINEG
tara:strand:- start:160 stop:402 length:243 start_codon:yes stop_codon:yes gene_type:complete